MAKLTSDQSLLEDRALETIERLFRLRNEAQVGMFINESPFLIPILLKASGKLASYFPLSQLILEVAPDPDEEGESELVLYITTELPPQEAHARLKQFDYDWWLGVVKTARGRLCITLEFV
ncbi:MAG: hypothetical protein L0229_17905 [Blastocatellia bacterium]|nr:hypothetical protein [Blastocatellia bacterium]